MAKAPAAEQLRLLELQALDGQLKSLAGQARQLKEDPKLAALTAEAAAAEADADRLSLERSDAQSAVKRSEEDVERVVSRIERDETRLNAGGLSKDLMALQTDLEALARRRAELEDIELALMESLEEVTERHEKQQSVADQRRQERDALRTELGARLREVTQQQEATATQRQELAASFAPELLSVYVKTLERRGIGAARLFHGLSEGSGMRLSPGDLAEIGKAAEDDIVFCPDSGCILVRSSEWG
ncbi:DNA-binding protein [Acaricomes phytoseiuli]|uniref:zinc ribbon domain-containing protein n=1 Tax=Acaricomes phytoseiuli TaxID=291968 RepID=UPI00037904E5|nr:C4-type zinc ribbon domain-containing protein [Acaricomes phytoseiuli]MCW1250188.1 DNA-binding protein [Acaricomes phytoseiuli]